MGKLGVALMIVGFLVTPLALLVAWGTAMDMDPPYDPVTPYLWVSLAGVATICVGYRVMRRYSRPPA